MDKLLEAAKALIALQEEFYFLSADAGDLDDQPEYKALKEAVEALS